MKIKTGYFILLLVVSVLLFTACSADVRPNDNVSSSITPTDIPKNTSESSFNLPTNTAFPDADEYGLREYEYNEQKVLDWIGDFPEADGIRKRLLEYIDSHVNKASGSLWEDDYYYIFLGIPVAINDGWLVPAGKRLDGEWMPNIFCLSKSDSKVDIQYKSLSMDYWKINNGHFNLANRDVYYFYGIVPTDSRRAIQDAHALSVIITDSNTRHENLLIPQDYPYFLCVSSTDVILKEISIFDARTNEQLPILLSDKNGNLVNISKHEMEDAIRDNLHIVEMSKVEVD